jgi:hypothetical protein
MKKLFSFVCAAVLATICGGSLSTAEAQVCKVRTLSDRHGYVVDQNMAIGIRKIAGIPNVYIKTRKGQTTFPNLWLRVGAASNSTPNVPLESYTSGEVAEQSISFNAAKKVYLANIQAALLEIARSPSRVGFIEGTQRVVIAGTPMYTPLTNVLQLTCRAPRGLPQ